MKKITLTIGFCVVVLTSHVHAMLNKPPHNDNFHGILLNQQIQKMICYDRADELKLWLDNSSTYKPVPLELLASLHAVAGQHNAQQCADILLTFMLKNGL